jgi:hypothetical protein
MKKAVLFAFDGDPMCFVHVLLNALDMKAKDYDVRIVLEGSATRLIPEFERSASPLKDLVEKAAASGLIEGACRACSRKMGTLDAASAQGIPLLDDMSGHPSMARYLDEGFEIITF